MSPNIVVTERGREGDSAPRCALCSASGPRRFPRGPRHSPRGPAPIPWGARSLLALLALAGCLQLSADSVYHVLKKGETLFSLSREYNVPVGALESANRIGDPSTLQVGTRLLIPSLHRIQSGETLFGIARQYGIGVEALMAANRLDAKSILRVG